MSCAAEVRWLRKYPRGMIEEISPRFNRLAPPPNHDKCGPNCRFWLRKKINYYYFKNKKLEKLIWKNGKKTNIESPYGLDFDLCNIWDISNVNTMSEELERCKWKGKKLIKMDNTQYYIFQWSGLRKKFGLLFMMYLLFLLHKLLCHLNF